MGKLNEPIGGWISVKKMKGVNNSHTGEVQTENKKGPVPQQINSTKSTDIHVAEFIRMSNGNSHIYKKSLRL